jgi:hypothetical protein
MGRTCSRPLGLLRLTTASGTAFTAVVLGQMATAFACRSEARWVGRLDWRGNPLLLGAVAAEIAALFMFIGIPALARLLGGGLPSLSAIGSAIPASRDVPRCSVRSFQAERPGPVAAPEHADPLSGRGRHPGQYVFPVPRGRSSRGRPRSAARHPPEPGDAGRAGWQRHLEHAGRRFGHDHNRAVRAPRAGTRHRAGRQPAQPSPAPGPEHEQIAAPRDAGELHGRPPGESLLLHGHVARHPADGLADGRPDQRVTVRHAIGVQIPGRGGHARDGEHSGGCD